MKKGRKAIGIVSLMVFAISFISGLLPMVVKAGANDYQQVNIVVNTYSEATNKGLESVAYDLYAGENIKDSAGNIVFAKGTKLKTAVTSSGGSALFSISVPVGKYYAMQSTCPTGYVKQDFKIFYEITSNQTYYSNNIYLPSSPDTMTLGVSAPAGVTGGDSYTINVSQLSNDSANNANNFVYIQNMPYNTSIESLTTGTYSADGNVTVFYTTNLNSDYQSLGTVDTKTNKTISCKNIALGNDEYVKSVIYSYGNVPGGFKATTAPQIIVKAAVSCRYGDNLSGSGVLSAFINGSKVSTSSTISSTVISTTTLYTNTNAKDNTDIAKVNNAASNMAKSEGYKTVNNTKVAPSNNTPSDDSIATGDATPVTFYTVITILSVFMLISSIVAIVLLQKGKNRLNEVTFGA